MVVLTLNPCVALLREEGATDGAVEAIVPLPRADNDRWPLPRAETSAEDRLPLPRADAADEETLNEDRVDSAGETGALAIKPTFERPSCPRPLAYGEAVWLTSALEEP